MEFLDDLFCIGFRKIFLTFGRKISTKHSLRLSRTTLLLTTCDSEDNLKWWFANGHRFWKARL